MGLGTGLKRPRAGNICPRTLPSLQRRCTKQTVTGGRNCFVIWKGLGRITGNGSGAACLDLGSRAIFEAPMNFSFVITNLETKYGSLDLAEERLPREVWPGCFGTAVC